MKRVTLLTLAILLPLIAAVQQSAPATPMGTYADSRYGFKITIPAFPPVKAGESLMTVMMYAPAEDEFAANVNVVVEKTQADRAEYAAAVRQEFEAAGLKLLSEKELRVSDRDASLWEYEGAMAGNELRWLALAVFDREQVYVVTCTSLASNYAKYEVEFQRSVRSFKLTGS